VATSGAGFVNIGTAAANLVYTGFDEIAINAIFAALAAVN
jgi:hypothetical protein